MKIEFTEDELKYGIGTVYISVLVEQLIIIYNGSTNEFHKRMWEHNSAIGSESEGRKFHKYLKANNLEFGKDVVMIPIIKFACGFETLLESDTFDCFKAAEKAGNDNVKLLTKDRPLQKKFTVDTWSYIYKYEDFGKEIKIDKVYDDPLYIGSTNEISRRNAEHDRDCYRLKKNKKFYKYLRNINDKSWPDNIKIVPIEVCPLFVQFQREKFYIDKYNMVADGLNGATTQRNHEERLAYNREYAKKNKETVDASRKKRYEKYKANRTEEDFKKQQERRRAQYEKDKEKVSKQSREWYQNNKERKKATVEKNRLAKKAAAKNNAEASSSSDPK